MSDAPEPYDLQFETVVPTARKVPARAPGMPQLAPARAPGLPQPAPAPVVRAQRVTTYADRRPICASCKQPIADSYYSAGRKVICPQCCARIMGGGAGAATLRVLASIGIGTLAGIIGAAIWMGVRHGTDREWGLVAVLVGFLVGAGVRMGSGNRGGVGYQIIAVVLTYLAVAANYTPDIYKIAVEKFEARHSVVTVSGGGTVQPVGNEPSTALKIVLVAVSFFLALIAPLLSLPQNFFGVIIILIALWEAWKINTPAISSVKGPFSLKAAGAPI